MRIVVDGRPLTRRPSGIGGFVQAALAALARERPGWVFDILANRKLFTSVAERFAPLDNVRFHQCALPVLSDTAVVWFLLKMPRLLRQWQPDLFWATTSLLPPLMSPRIKTLVTVYDFVTKLYPYTMHTIERWHSRFRFDASVERADLLWAISDYTRRELERNYPARRCTNTFVGCSHDPGRLQLSESREQAAGRVRKQYNIVEPFILYVGNLEPRKNLRFLLELMPKLAGEGLSLAIVGASGWGSTGIEQVMCGRGFPRERVRLLGFVDYDDLAVLYHSAAVFVSASLNEGFGLPQLEAMACGCPVVTAHNSAMIEVVEGAGITVSGWDHDDWIRAIKRAISERDYFSRAGIARAGQYSWARIAKKLAQRIEAAVGG